MTGEPLIHVYPTELWQYVCQNRKLITENIVVIAENPTREIEIIARIGHDMPTISVYKGGVLLRDDQIVSKEDAVITCRVVYSRFLTPSDQTPAAAADHTPEDDDEEEDEKADEREPDEDEEEIIMEMIDEREAALNAAIEDFLTVVLEDQSELVQPDELDEILDEFLTSLADRGFSIYRPTLIEDDLVDYPYEESESGSKN